MTARINLRKIELCRQYQEKVKKACSALQSDYTSGKISYNEYFFKVSILLRGHTQDSWLSYYDSLIIKLKNGEKISHILTPRIEKQHYGLLEHLLIISIVGLLLSLLYSGLAISPTGLAILDAFRQPLIDVSSQTYYQNDSLLFAVNPSSIGVYKEAYIINEEGIVDAVSLECLQPTCYDTVVASIPLSSYSPGEYQISVYDYKQNDYAESNFSIISRELALLSGIPKCEGCGGGPSTIPITIIPGLILEYINITPNGIVNPTIDSNTSMNVVVRITNTSTINLCQVGIYNNTNLVFNPASVMLSNPIKCVANWTMSYWMNPGIWNVTVNVNTTGGSKKIIFGSFIYNELKASITSPGTINFTGNPGELIQSSNAYPMTIKNAGNIKFNISISGTDYVGKTNSTFRILLGNTTLNQTSTGIFSPLTYAFSQIYLNTLPRDISRIFFKTFIPIGLPSQEYEGNITIVI